MGKYFLILFFAAVCGLWSVASVNAAEQSTPASAQVKKAVSKEASGKPSPEKKEAVTPEAGVSEAQPSVVDAKQLALQFWTRQNFESQKRQELSGLLVRLDRKSTRLNSSHSSIS